MQQNELCDAHSDRTVQGAEGSASSSLESLCEYLSCLLDIRPRAHPTKENDDRVYFELHLPVGENLVAKQKQSHNDPW